MTAPVDAPADPRKILGALSALRTLSGTTPAGHPMITERLREADEAVQQALTIGTRPKSTSCGVVRERIPFDGDNDIRGSASTAFTFDAA